ncbi:MAG: hypothetical protein EOP06_00075 [Proteobacteria bacterium]|nr:MAG: hypothetical protein EOP06_00075 [Pseudomonadota bacterium]
MRNIPIEDQGSTSLCYAYAGAFLANTYLMDSQQYSSPLIHPFELALINRQDPQNELYNYGSLGGGYVGVALRSLRSRAAVCGRSQIELRMSKLVAAGSFRSNVDAIQFLESNNLKQQFAKIYDRRFCSTNPHAQQWLAMHELSSVTQKVAIERLLRRCEKRIIELPKVLEANRFSDEDFAKAVQIALARHRPVGLETSCSTRFFKDGFRGRGVTFRSVGSGIKRESTEACEREKHATAIVGQRSVAGQCEYLVRNSVNASVPDQKSAGCSCRDVSTGVISENCVKPTGKNRMLGCWYSRSDILGVALNATAFE